MSGRALLFEDYDPLGVYGPRNRLPSKWMRWLGASAHQTSVSQEMSAR